MTRPRKPSAVRHALAAACTGLLLLGFQAAPAPRSDPQTLGVAVARELLAATNATGALVAELAADRFALAHDLPRPHGWRLRLREAAVEAVEAARPDLERRAGRALAATFTEQELRAIGDFLATPGGQALLGYLADLAADRPASTPTGEARAQVERFLLTPEGRALRDELEDPGPLIEALDDEAVQVLAPDVVRRYRQKIGD